MPTNCVTEISDASVKFGIYLETDNTFGFPILSRVDLSSPLQTQVPIQMQHNRWMVVINSKNTGYIEPITTKFCIDE